MNEPTINNIVHRLDRLERENRRLKRIGALVLVGIAAVVLMGQAKPSKVPKVIEAQEFVLKDSNGGVRGVLGKISSNMAMGFSPDQNYGLILYNDFKKLGNSQGGWRIVGLSGSGLRLTHYKHSQMELAALVAKGFFTGTASDEWRKIKGSTEVDFTGFKVYGKNGKSSAVLGQISLEYPHTGVKEQRPASSLVLFDKDGNNRASLTLGPDGSPTFELYDKSGAVLTQEPSTTRPSGPMWVLWSQTGDLSLPISAWPTKNECEAQIGGGTQAFLGKEALLVNCLPDTINFRGKR